jgi:glycerol-3-phosphate dehydrogenase
VGTEVRDAVLSLDVVDPGGTREWYGESGTRIRNAFLAKVRLLRGASIVSGEVQFERLWRCYDSRALKLVQKFEDEPDAREVILAADGITRGELELVRDTEMVVTLEDFLRRRTLLTQTRGKDELAGPAMMQVCEILFGSKASVRYQEYFGANSSEEA